jgi:hypothetical protein
MAASADAAPVTGREFVDAVMAERATHVPRGYDAAHDAEQGAERLLTWAMKYAQRGEHIKSWAIVQAARELLARSAPVTVETVEDLPIAQMYESGQVAMAVADRHGQPWVLWESEQGHLCARSYLTDDEQYACVDAEGLAWPLTVLTSAAQERTEQAARELLARTPLPAREVVTRENLVFAMRASRAHGRRMTGRDGGRGIAQAEIDLGNALDRILNDLRSAGVPVAEDVER